MNNTMKFLACSLVLMLSGVEGTLRAQRALQAAEEAPPADWTYRSQGTPGVEPYGPSDWHLGYPDCAGTQQSPVNLAAVVQDVDSADAAFLKFNQNSCDSTDLKFTSDFAVWKVDFDGCAVSPNLVWKGETYNLLQMHLHSPSEYTFGGSEHAAGFHLVHLKNGTTTDLLVLGLLFDTTEFGINNELEKLWSVFRTGAATTTEKFTTSVYDLLPPNRSFTHFFGSLTTPPCTEGVKWIVMNQPCTMGRAQLEEYRDSVATAPLSKVSEFGNTNRPIQELNGRDLKTIS